jgi:hypothetical protein
MWREERAAIWEAVGRSKEEAIRESRSELSAESSALNQPRKTWRRSQKADEDDHDEEEEEGSEGREREEMLDHLLSTSVAFSESDRRL